MHIFVINLLENTARRIAIERQLQALNLSYEIFPAIKGISLSPEKIKQCYSEKWFHRNEGRSMLPGELGCALSHIEIYRMVVERGLSHALILEDDAWLNPNLPMLLHSIKEKFSPANKDVYLLTWFREIALGNFENIWSAYHIAKVRSAYCSHGYIVSNSAALELIKALYPVHQVADCWGWLIRHQIVSVRAVFPTCITADLSYETNTTLELQKNVNLKLSLSRKLFRRSYRGWWLIFDHAQAIYERILRKFSAQYKK